MELGKRRVEFVEVRSVPEEKVLTLEEEPVLTLSLRVPTLEGDTPPLRRIGRCFARQAQVWRARWEGPLYAAACAALFATALAVSPGLREVLGTALGSFAPYAQDVEVVSAADQGIEVRVVSALSDGNRSVAYLEVRDLTGDRIGPDTFLSLAIGGLSRQPAAYSASRYGGGRPLHYDTETGTILTSVELTVDGPPASSGTLDVVFERLTPSLRRKSGTFSPSLLTGSALETVTL